jgi:hypothetical protein
MIGEVGAQLIGLIYALYMMVVIVNSLWNEELFEWLTVEYRA